MGNAILCYSCFLYDLPELDSFACAKMYKRQRWENTYKYHFVLEVLASIEPKMYRPAVLSRACNFDTCSIFSVVKLRQVVLFWCTWMFHAGGIYELCSHPVQRGKLSELCVQGKSRGQRGWSKLPWGHLLNLPWWGASGGLDHWMELSYALLYVLNILLLVFVHI